MTQTGQAQNARGTTIVGSSTSVSTQIASFTIDFVAVAAIAAGVYFAFESTLLAALAVFESCVILWVLEARTGLTVGNAILRVRHSRATGAFSPGAGRALIRQLVMGLGLAIGVVGGWVMAASGTWDPSGRKRSLAARASGTIAVTPPGGKQSATATPPQALQVPQAVVTGRSSPARERTRPGPDRPAASAAPVAAPAAPAQGANPVLVTSLEPTTPQAPPAAHTVAAPTIAPIPGARAPEPVAQPTQPAPEPQQAAIAPSAPSSTASDLVAPDLMAPDAAASAPSTTDHLTLSEPRAPQAGGLLLVFDTGQRATIALTPGSLDATISLGRKPSASTPTDQLIIVQDPEGTVSKTHARIEHALGQTWVIDQGSTNGTDLLDEDGATLLEPGARTLVDDGSRIRLGNRTLTVSVLLDAAPDPERSA